MFSTGSFRALSSRALVLLLLAGASVAQADDDEPAEPAIEVFLYPSTSIGDHQGELYYLLSTFFPGETVLVVTNPPEGERGAEAPQWMGVIDSETGWFSDLRRSFFAAEEGGEYVAPRRTDRPRLVVGVPPQFDVVEGDVRLVRTDASSVEGLLVLCSAGRALVRDRILGACRVGPPRVDPVQAHRWDLTLVPVIPSLEPRDVRPPPDRVVFFEPDYGSVLSFDASAGPVVREGDPFTLIAEVDEAFALAKRAGVTDLVLRGATAQWAPGAQDLEYRARTSLESGRQTLEIGIRGREDVRFAASLRFEVYDEVEHEVEAGDGVAYIDGEMRPVPFWAKRSTSERNGPLHRESWRIRATPWKIALAFLIALCIGYFASKTRRRRPLGVVLVGSKGYREAATGRVVRAEGPISSIDPSLARATAVLEGGVLRGDFIVCDVSGKIHAMNSLSLGSEEAAVWDHGCSYRIVDASRFDVDAEPRVALITNDEAAHFASNPLRPFPVWFRLFISQFLGATAILFLFEAGVTVLGSLLPASCLLAGFALVSVAVKSPPVWE